MAMDRWYAGKQAIGQVIYRLCSTIRGKSLEVIQLQQSWISRNLTCKVPIVAVNTQWIRQLTDVGDAVVSETMGGGELVSPPQGEDEGIALVCSQHCCVLLQRQSLVLQLHAPYGSNSKLHAHRQILSDTTKRIQILT